MAIKILIFIAQPIRNFQWPAAAEINSKGVVIAGLPFSFLLILNLCVCHTGYHNVICNKEFCFFFSGKLLCKSNREFSAVFFIAWCKHFRGCSWKFCQPWTSSCVCIANSSNTLLCLYQDMQTQKSFLLLKLSLFVWITYSINLSFL